MEEKQGLLLVKLELQIQVVVEVEELKIRYLQPEVQV